MVDFGDRAFLSANATREIAEVVDGERQVGGHGFADRLAVIDQLDKGEDLEVLLHPVGDLVEDIGALGRRGPPPSSLRFVRRIERKLYVRGLTARDLADRLTGDGAKIDKVLSANWRHPTSTNKVVVAGAPDNFTFYGVNGSLKHGRVLPW